MPKKSPSNSMMLDLSYLSKAVKTMKNNGYQVAPTSQSNDNDALSVTIATDPNTEAGSAMEKPKKPKKTPEQTAADRITAAITKAIEQAEIQINRKLIAHVLQERVRQAINAKFHDRLSPADIDRFSRDASRGISYELNDVKIIPEQFLAGAMLDLSAKNKQNYTEEPDGEAEIDE